LTYRGIAIEALFEQSTFEETVFLLWFGQLPSQTDLAAFRARIEELSAVSVGAQVASGNVTRMLEAGVLELGAQPIEHADAVAVPLHLLVGLSELIARSARSDTPLADGATARGSSIAERFLTAWRGEAPHPDDARAFDRGLILIADHELNAATFAARVAASTGADFVSVILAAVATQSGPLHGGALTGAGLLLQAVLARDAETEIDRRLAAGQKIPGFGHSVYRNGDPRAALFRQLLAETSDRTGDRRWLTAADQLAQVTPARIGVPPNLDLYAAAYWSAIGLPPELFPAVFAMGRLAGWIAHVREQVADNRLIRPRARYVGRTGELYVPIEERGEWFTRGGTRVP
jgi:citrate synthase